MAETVKKKKNREQFHWSYERENNHMSFNIFSNSNGMPKYVSNSIYFI
jgi:hypothetical protein